MNYQIENVPAEWRSGVTERGGTAGIHLPAVGDKTVADWVAIE